MILWLILALTFRAPATAVLSQAPGNPLFRIGLVRAFGRIYSVTVAVRPGYRVTTGDSVASTTGSGVWTVAAANGSVQVTDSGGSLLTSGDAVRIDAGGSPDSAPLEVRNAHKARHYRGVLEFRLMSERSPTLLVVNELPIEDYLRGVVAAEIGGSAPREAQKAQAIAARTYALKVRGKYRGAPYDLNDTTDSQMYEGADGERASTDSAVRETAGLVVQRNGQLVLTDYYDDCGGVTSCGSDADDYPPSVLDSANSGEPDYCARGAYHTWSLTLTAAKLEACLSASERRKVGHLQSVCVAETDSSGRALKVELEGDSGSVILRGYVFRGRVGYSALKSTLFTLSRRDDGGFDFLGRGYGHGHGLCQAGAIGMASAPYNRTCAEILAHYFPGSTIAPLQTPEAAHPTLP